MLSKVKVVSNPKNKNSFPKNILNKIKQTEPDFDEMNFQSFARNTFEKYYKSFCTANWETMKAFATQELVDDCKRRMKKIEDTAYIFIKRDLKKINAVEVISFEQKAEKDFICTIIDFEEECYELNPKTNKKINGLKKQIRYRSKLVFERNSKDAQYDRKNENSFTHCQRCGAPSQVVTTGKCEYCGEIIQGRENTWKLCSSEF